MGKLRLAFALAALSALAGTLAGRAARPDPAPDSFGCGGGGDCGHTGSTDCSTAQFLGRGNTSTDLSSTVGGNSMYYAWTASADSGNVMYEFSNFAAGITFEIYPGCNSGRIARGTVPVPDTGVNVGPTVAVKDSMYFIKITAPVGFDPICGNVRISQ